MLLLLKINAAKTSFSDIALSYGTLTISRFIYWICPIEEIILQILE